MSRDPKKPCSYLTCPFRSGYIDPYTRLPRLVACFGAVSRFWGRGVMSCSDQCSRLCTGPRLDAGQDPFVTVGSGLPRERVPSWAPGSRQRRCNLADGLGVDQGKTLVSRLVVPGIVIPRCSPPSTAWTPSSRSKSWAFLGRRRGLQNAEEHEPMGS